MSFDFFNNSYLAFGSKLTTAFNTLENMIVAAERNLEQVIKDQDLYKEYYNRNYLVPRPISPTSPCRANEIFDVMNDKNVYLNKLKYNGVNLEACIGLFNRSNNRITRLEGTTDLKEGYAFYSSEAISNSNVDRELKFVSDFEDVKGILLFQYRIGLDGTINLVGSVSNLYLIPESINYLTGMSFGSKVSSGGSYTAQDFECLCVIGKENNIEVKLDGTTILKGQGHNCVRHCIIYAKKGAKITGTYDSIYRINYNR